MRVKQHVNDAKDALNDGNIVQAGSKLEIVDSLLDQLDAMTSKSDSSTIIFKISIYTNELDTCNNFYNKLHLR